MYVMQGKSLRTAFDNPSSGDSLRSNVVVVGTRLGVYAAYAVRAMQRRWGFINGAIVRIRSEVGS